jgi:hypothetical protein
LDLSNNHISGLKDDYFSRFSHLLKLRLSGNSIPLSESILLIALKGANERKVPLHEGFSSRLISSLLDLANLCFLELAEMGYVEVIDIKPKGTSKEITYMKAKATANTALLLKFLENLKDLVIEGPFEGEFAWPINSPFSRLETLTLTKNGLTEIPDFVCKCKNKRNFHIHYFE